PKKYVEKVGDEAFKKAPVGAGPYEFVSFNPGVELVLEAYEQYWRKAPSVKRLVFKSVPDESTRLAMLKRGEADVAYSIRGALAEEIRRTPGLTLKATGGAFTEWIVIIDQWDPKSPWADRRVRQAANLAIVRQRRDAHRSVRAIGRHVRLRRLSRHRRTLPRAGLGARSKEARGDLAQDPAAHARQGDLRAALRARVPQRLWTAGGGIRARA